MKRKPSSDPSYAAPKPTVDQLLASGEQLNRTSTDFLKTDLETLLIFTKSALNTDNPERKTRNRRAARKGYDTIVRLIGKVKLTQDDVDFFSKKLRRLKSDLRSLGELF